MRSDFARGSSKCKIAYYGRTIQHLKPRTSCNSGGGNVHLVVGNALVDTRHTSFGELGTRLFEYIHPREALRRMDEQTGNGSRCTF